MKFIVPYMLLALNLALTAGLAKTVFSDEEITVDFGELFAVRQKPGKVFYAKFLPKPLSTVDFCAWQPAPPMCSR